MNQTQLQPLLDEVGQLPRSTTLIHENGVRCLVLHLKPGEEIPEHNAPGAITVHCLTGHARFLAGGESAELTASSLISLPAGVPHSLIAQQETLLLVTLSEQQSTPQSMTR
jgi:quercetin dioxygenase-like cupin family protein